MRYTRFVESVRLTLPPVMLASMLVGVPLAVSPAPAAVAPRARARWVPSTPAPGAAETRRRGIRHPRFDSRQLAARGLVRPAVAAARAAAEAAADAGLAMVGLANPNPKWRVVLLEQSVEDPRASWLPAAELLAAIMDGPADGDPGPLLATACRAAHLIASDTMLAMYHEAALTRRIVDGIEFDRVGSAL